MFGEPVEPDPNLPKWIVMIWSAGLVAAFILEMVNASSP